MYPTKPYSFDMANAISFDGNLTVQLTPGARPAPIPVKFAGTYAEKLIYEFNLGVVTNQAVPQGTVTNPRFILIWVYEGQISLSTESDGGGPLVIQANPTPPPTDSPVMMLMRYSPGATQFYITTTAPARGEIWLLE